MPVFDRRPDGRSPRAAHDGWTVVPLHGDLDYYSAEDFSRELGSVTAAGSRHVVLDMHDVSFMDSTGLRVLLGTARQLRDSGGALRLADTHEHVRRVLEITQVAVLLPTYGDVGSACDD